MQINRGFRQGVVSLLVFAGLIGGLMWADPRVNEQMQSVLFGSRGVSSWDNRVADASLALVSVARYQTIDNPALVLFGLVGIVLFVFMFKA